jgi:hypothetical protein
MPKPILEYREREANPRWWWYFVYGPRAIRNLFFLCVGMIALSIVWFFLSAVLGFR